MSRSRRYRLLCPISRALDHIGDRWTLLVLRDLHAGPARFTDLQAGLTGLASNLLTDRLRRLEADGLVRRRPAEFGTTVYELTELGESTGELLFSLARLGSRFPPAEDLRRPGNLRSVAVALEQALNRVVDSTTRLHAGLLIDGEAFQITIADGNAQVRYRPVGTADVIIATNYEAFMAVGDDDIPLTQFVEEHVELVEGDPESAADLFDLLERAVAVLNTDSD
jgi:DNA-binding HxlR family transcriptional regulator